MSVDLARRRAAFLDLTFIGLDAIPGRARSASPARLPALARRRRDHRGRRRAARAARPRSSRPLGDDSAARTCARALEAEGVALVRPPPARARRRPWSCRPTATARW